MGYVEIPREQTITWRLGNAMDLSPIMRNFLESMPVPCTQSTQKKFPAIVDVKIGKERLSKEEKQKIEEKNRKNVYTIVMFDDDTVEKVATADGDEYNLEQGIQICLAKKAFSLINGNGSNTFNNLVNKAVKLYNNKENEKQRAKECEEKAKVAAKAEADKIKRKKDKEREKRINEMAEAYARAMRMANESGNNT